MTGVGLTAAARSWSKLFHVAAWTIAILGLGFATTDMAIGWVVPMALGGGALVAGVLIAVRSRQEHRQSSADPFARDGLYDVMNLSHVRVAGLGGACLLLVAGAVALEYPLVTAVVVAGLCGGAIAGVAMIWFRRP